METISLDHYLDRQMTPTYKCVDFAADVWRELTGKQLSTPRSPSEMRLRSLLAPVSPCIVYMQTYEAKHVGIFYDGEVLQLDESGVSWQSLYTIRRIWRTVRFYE